ncbi:S-adenosyl-L-methionine-dependent methyltransferase [Epithele typhae]|uniref:S-adenosyl-L-methionine-dependent methyltransferase n=1 Tax=Epithele typhae TaxID=378194 RepID=UPI00200813A4|nr:S-adenosyl-L-methionine-dependent methyltransferase [Epithele typhae]KAH9946053.1 S-adenosyl-L-methionine-dependent methyltransferase [Epithele typhae]
MSTVHNVAKAGFGIGNDLYDRARPSYQTNAIAHIRQPSARRRLSTSSSEIGSGTGIFTRALLAHPAFAADVGALRAVEPSAGMRDVFTKTVADPRASIVEGAFDTTSVEDGWADAIIIAQAFHWCPDYPGGVVALIWNLEDRNRATWRHEKDTPQFRLGLWRATFTTPTYGTLFEPQEENVWDYVLPGTRDIVVDRACSKSYIAVLTPEERVKVVEDIDGIIQRKDGMTWMEEDKGVFEYPYQTFLVVMKKK